jgi:DNA-binding protein YbaB
VAFGPETQAALERAQANTHLLDDMIERMNGIRARRPSPGGWVLPEVDCRRRLTDLYIAPGTIERLTNDQLAAEIMAAISESTADAGRQQALLVEGIVKTMGSPSEPPSAGCVDQVIS